MSESNKRTAEEDESCETADEWIGPMPNEASKPKKRKGSHC